MLYADSHIEFIHYPEDLKGLKDPSFLDNQINPKLINQITPHLLFAACYVLPSSNAWDKLIWTIKQYLAEVKKQKWSLVQNKEDLKKPGTKIILHVEDLSPIGSDLSKIDQLYELGVRSIGLTHNRANQFAGGSLEDDKGLTELGRKAIQKIINLGIILDFVHLSTTALKEVIDIFNLRPFISHTGLYSIHSNPRNIKDEILEIVKIKDGYLGIGFAGSFLAKEKATTEDVVKQIQYAVKIVGEERVGIGSDFGGIISFVPKSLEDFSKIKNLEKYLQNKDILGRNLRQFVLEILS